MNLIEGRKIRNSITKMQTIAIIACLNIAYDLFLEKNKNRELLIQAADKIKKLKLLLNDPSLVEPS